MQIALPLFALLAFLGALRVWRRSPLYSIEITLKVAGVVLLSVAAGVSVTVASFSSPLGLYARDAAATVAGAGILIVTVGASAIIARLTEGHIAHLPESAQFVTIHRRRVYEWVWRI